MTAHVFIVDEKTFPWHLRYQFAGTGGKKHRRVSFNNSPESDIPPKKVRQEIMLAGMIADICRVRSGDKVIFYLQQQKKEEGRFYGIFRAKSSGFLDNGGDKQFLGKELGKSLTFRVPLEPEQVYAKGVTEWRALDEIKNIEHPCQMLWSLIYRKLKGHRGCTMITPYEAERLCTLIRSANEGDALACCGQQLDFDTEKRKIVVHKNSSPYVYTGERKEFAMLPRIVRLNQSRRSFEAHLQAHISGQLGMPDDELSKILLDSNVPEWLGNEVSCGVGMQSIDLMVSFLDKASKSEIHHVMPIELKSVKASADNLRQIQRYVDWIQQYYISNCESVISLVLITKAGGMLPSDFAERVRCFNNENVGDICKPLRMVEFSVDSGGISYEERDFC